MADISDFLRSYMGLAQMVQQQKQFEAANLLETEAAARDAIQDFQSIASQTVDPDQRHALARRFARPTGMTAADLLNLAPPPEEGVIRRFTEREGVLGDVDPMSPLANKPDLLQIAASQGTVGMRPDQVQAGQYVGEVFRQAREQGVPEGLPREAGVRAAGVGGTHELLLNTAATMLQQNELIQGAGVQNQTRMSAGQDASNQLGYANNRLGWANLLAQTHQAMQGAGGADNASAQSLQDEIGKALRMLQENKGQMSNEEAEIWRAWYNSLAVRARHVMGVRLPQLGSIEDIQNPGVFQSFEAPTNAADTIAVPQRAPSDSTAAPTGADILTILERLRTGG